MPIDFPKLSRLLLALALIASVAAVTAVGWHSLGEIHYLKSFFPTHFTVQQAFYAAAIELIKVLIISLPLVLIAVVCLRLLRPSVVRSERNG